MSDEPRGFDRGGAQTALDVRELLVPLSHSHDLTLCPPSCFSTPLLSGPGEMVAVQSVLTSLLITGQTSYVSVSITEEPSRVSRKTGSILISFDIC